MREYGRIRSAGERPSSKKQKGHWSDDGLGDAGGDRGSEGSDDFMILLFSLSRFGIIVLTVLSESSSPRFEIIVSLVLSALF
jgi:hypothetical protein